MPRERIAMTPDEVAAFLARKALAVVGTLDGDGAPDAEPVQFAWRDGAIQFEVDADGPMHRHLGADARVVCSVEEFPSYAEIKGVAVHGTAVATGAAGGRVTYRIDATRVESFDFAKIRPRE